MRNRVNKSQGWALPPLDFYRRPLLSTSLSLFPPVPPISLFQIARLSIYRPLSYHAAPSLVPPFPQSKVLSSPGLWSSVLSRDSPHGSPTGSPPPRVRPWASESSRLPACIATRGSPIGARLSPGTSAAANHHLHRPPPSDDIASRFSADNLPDMETQFNSECPFPIGLLALFVYFRPAPSSGHASTRRHS